MTNSLDVYLWVDGYLIWYPFGKYVEGRKVKFENINKDMFNYWTLVDMYVKTGGVGSNLEFYYSLPGETLKSNVLYIRSDVDIINLLRTYKNESVIHIFVEELRGPFTSLDKSGSEIRKSNEVLLLPWKDTEVVDEGNDVGGGNVEREEIYHYNEKTQEQQMANDGTRDAVWENWERVMVFGNYKDNMRDIDNEVAEGVLEADEGCGVDNCGTVGLTDGVTVSEGDVVGSEREDLDEGVAAGLSGGGATDAESENPNT
ncbi:uncharacterized protein LOC127253800 isoform X1 [Andrographis paniculata]|uniref:uncharacterized protein LOC127253800 isoform X1 n=1 Tax=Andrographis paniculata TaxID=175694 RepID=UPI0021E96AC8|nr:uncharacterized protein LOC127253800 isoform X1 [Andrographis paniculata]